MRLIKDGVVFDLVDPMKIAAFKAAGYIEEPEPEPEQPEPEQPEPEAKPKRTRKTTTKAE